MEKEIYFITNSDGEVLHDDYYRPCFYDSVEKAVDAIKEWYGTDGTIRKQSVSERDADGSLEVEFEIDNDIDPYYYAFIFPVKAINPKIVGSFDSSWNDFGETNKN